MHVRNCLAIFVLLDFTLQCLIAVSNDTCELEAHAASGVALLSLKQRRIRSLRLEDAQAALQSLELQKEEPVSVITPVQDQANGTNQTNIQMMKSTPDGVCMYDLPDSFNTQLLDSVFSATEPQPLDISPRDMPPLQGMFDTNQFSLDRIFFDRMTVAATQTRAAHECKLFYVPYFVSWETSATNGIWRIPMRYKLDRQLLQRLTFFSPDKPPEKTHFLIIGRISRDLNLFLAAPEFQHMVKLVLEDTEPGRFSNLFPVPYPTWFRYSPSLEPSEEQVMTQSTISVKALGYQADHTELPVSTNCSLHWLANWTTSLRAACDGRSWCHFFLGPADNETGIFAAGAAGAGCPSYTVSGTYACDDGPLKTFQTKVSHVSTGHAVVLSCQRGPRWLWNGTENQKGEPAGARNNQARTGPIATIIGSTPQQERERFVIHQMCQTRPHLCANFDTGLRVNSSSSVSQHIADMYQLIMASTFCINAPGDTPTRKGLFDSLVLGCIPVIVDEDSLQYYRIHLPDWRSVSVLVTTEQLYAPGFNLFDYLAAFAKKDSEELRVKQRAIQDVAYSLQYSFIPANISKRGPDAFDRILQHVQSLDVSESNATPVNNTLSAINGSNFLTWSNLGEKCSTADFGVGNLTFRVVNSTWSSNSVWHLQRRGQNSCSFRIVENVSGFALHDFPSDMNVTKVVTGSNRRTRGEDRWRFKEQGDGSFKITNVASGRRLFAPEGLLGSGDFGAAFQPTGSMDQTWEVLVKAR